MAGYSLWSREGGTPLSEERGSRNGWRWPLVAGLVILGAISAFTTLACGAGGTTQSGGRDQAESSGEKEEQASSGGKLGHPSLGSEEAPVTMIE